jgi:outer membrane protein assembly factor BamB
MTLSPRLPRAYFHYGFFSLVVCFSLCAASSAKPHITLSRKVGPPTTQILVSGSGFEPNAGVDIYFDTKDELLVVTDGRGEFKGAKAHAPRSARPGNHWVTALERNNDKGAQKPFVVFTNWPQVGFDPSLSGLNPYENVLDRHNVGGLDVAWSYTVQTYSAMIASPVVWEGAVYVAFNGGMLYAFDAETGAVLWKHAGPVGSPAVGNGLVYAYNGQRAAAQAFNAHTGKLLWSRKINGNIGGPAFPTVADGKVFIGNGNGPLYALNATTGALLWMFSSHEGLFYYGPAVGNGVVYVCDEDDAGEMGTCYALDEKNGSLLWDYAVYSGPITSSPALAQGLVFFEEQYQGIFALDASTGALVWHYHTQSFRGSPAVANGVVYVGGDAGLIALDAYTGKLLWTGADGQVNAPAIANGVVYAITIGATIDARDADTGTLLWTYPMGTATYYDPAIANGWVFAPSYSSDNGLITQLYAFRLKRSYATGDKSSTNRPKLSTLRPDLSFPAWKSRHPR